MLPLVGAEWTRFRAARLARKNRTFYPLRQPFCRDIRSRLMSFRVHAMMAAIMAVMSGPVAAEDDFSIAGTYVQNAACKGDGTDPAAKLVRITETDVHSSFGICKF